MDILWVQTLPAIAIWLVLLAILERASRRIRRPRDAGTPMAAASFDEFVSFLYGTKRVELAQRSTQSLMRQEENTSAPPCQVDLTSGTAVFAPHHFTK
jgi:hypothetical protein